MKKTTLVFALWWIPFSLIAQQITPKEAWLEKWENSKTYLLALAEAMPETNYAFKPTERQMSFEEQLLHIKGNIDWLSTTYFSEDSFNKNDGPSPKSKAELLAMLAVSFEKASQKVLATKDSELKETVDFFAGPKSKLQILNLLQDHLTHHRGQLIVYLNLNKIEPPRYVGW